MSRGTKRVRLIGVGAALIAISLSGWSAWFRIERRYQEVLEARRQLELQLGELRADRDRLSDVLAVEQQHVAQLSATLSAKDAELQEAIGRLSQEERVIQELQGKFLAMQHQFDRLQGELALTLRTQTSSATRPPTASLEAGRMVQLEKVVVTHPASSGPGLQGRVISVHPEWRFVVIDLGWDVVSVGDVVWIYRNAQLLGKARIERVQEQISAASLLPEWTEAEIQVNDEVRAL